MRPNTEPDAPRGPEASTPPPASVRVKISTPRPQVAERFEGMLEKADDIHVLKPRGAAASDSERHDAKSADVLILDCGTLTSQKASQLRRIAGSHQPARVLWLLGATPASRRASRVVLDAVTDGWCHGYIVDGLSSDALARAIMGVARLDVWLPRALLLRALSEAEGLRARSGARAAAERGRSGTRALLTLRERQVLHLVRDGLTNKEIGRHLGIEEDTVKKHLRNVFEKLGVSRRASLLLKRTERARAPA